MTSRSVRWLASLVIIGTLIGASAAQASIIATATLIKQPAGTPFANSPAGTTYSSLPAPWVSYRLSLTASGNDTIQAVTADIKGGLHQGWSSSGGDGTYDTPTGNSTNATNGDSHFMATASMLFANGPNEDNPFTGSPLVNDSDNGYGVGTEMSATFGPPGVGVTSLNVAYIVVKKGQEPQTNLSVVVFSPTGDIITSLGNKDFGGAFAPVVPEPTSVALAGIGMVGFLGLIRRRK